MESRPGVGWIHAPGFIQDRNHVNCTANPKSWTPSSKRLNPKTSNPEIIPQPSKPKLKLYNLIHFFSRLQTQSAPVELHLRQHLVDHVGNIPPQRPRLPLLWGLRGFPTITGSFTMSCSTDSQGFSNRLRRKKVHALGFLVQGLGLSV